MHAIANAVEPETAHASMDFKIHRHARGSTRGSLSIDTEYPLRE